MAKYWQPFFAYLKNSQSRDFMSLWIGVLYRNKKMSNIDQSKQIVSKQTANNIWVDQLSTSFACKFSSVNHTFTQ